MDLRGAFLRSLVPVRDDHEVNRALAVVLVALWGARSARADVTVIYAEPAAPAPLVASVVTEPMTEGPRARTEPAAAPAPIPAPAPAPTPAPARPAIRPPSPPLRAHIIRALGDGEEDATLRLLDGEGRPDPASLAELSILARPAGAERPDDAALEAHRDDLHQLTDELPRLHPALLHRLARIAERFPGHAIRIVSGVRPDAAESSRHRIARALDVRVDGVALDELDAFLRTLPETGVGLCPGEGFVHIDVRARSTHWVEVGAGG